MLQVPKVLQSPIKFFHPTVLPTPPSRIQNTPTSPSFPSIKQCHELSRRNFVLFSNSSSLLLLTSQVLGPFNLFQAQAGETLPEANNVDQQEGRSTCSNSTPTKRAFLDISIDGQPAGRIVIGLHGEEVPAAAARFSNLVSGAAGISYRRKEFIKIMPNYVQHVGVRSYGVDAELAQRTGSDLGAETLVDEWQREYEKCPGIKNLAGTVSIIVRDPLKPPPKLKLVAKKGKLEIDEEKVGTDPNGTEFVIAIRDSPELDASALVVGRVLEGMEVAAMIGQVKTVQENTSSPYFRCVHQLRASNFKRPRPVGKTSASLVY
uniref:Peptidyl-prolyl cis-trans isomerase cyclophilin-type family protein n=1 Tax=Rhizophora mucronata TaxID=61149 RepID=A0A2P2KTK1_RHIMU